MNTDIDQLIKDYGLERFGGLAIHYSSHACACWFGETSEKGYVTILPPEKGVVWAKNPELAIHRLVMERTQL
jgi:hypothetical protein